MKHPQEYTVRRIIKLLRAAGNAAFRSGDLGAEITVSWGRTGVLGRIVVRPDGTAEGAFPPEFFATLCPDP